MKKYIILILVCFPFVFIKSQVKVEYSLGYGQYKMDDMKNLLTDLEASLRNQYPLDITVVDNFPSYVTHKIGMVYKQEKHEFGANVMYLSTAGKLAYSDYSGEILNKLTLNAYRLGLLYRYNFYQTKLGEKFNLSVFGELSPGITLTTLKGKGYTKVGDNIKNMDDKYLFDSNMTGFSVLPQLGVNLDLLYGLGIHISGGYDFEMGSSLKDRKDIKANWSGLRFEGGISYRLPF